MNFIEFQRTWAIRQTVAFLAITKFSHENQQLLIIFYDNLYTIIFILSVRCHIKLKYVFTKLILLFYIVDKVDKLAVSVTVLTDIITRLVNSILLWGPFQFQYNFDYNIIWVRPSIRFLDCPPLLSILYMAIFIFQKISIHT